MTTSRRSFLKRFGALTGGTALMPIAKAGTMKEASTKLVPLSRDSSWAEVQNQFMLDPEIIYMNIGTEGSLPRPVYDAYITSLKQFTASPTDAAFLNEDLNYYQETNREKVAKFMGAEKDEIVITGNTTMGVNVVLFGLDYKNGDEIISTHHDHVAELSPSKILAKRRDIKFTQIAIPSPPSDKKEIISAFRKAIRQSQNKPKVMLICHINFTTGLRMPVKELCQLAKENNMISVVDGAHGLGMLDLNMKELGCDYYSTAGHKWLNCLPGTGVLYMKGGSDNPRGMWPVLTEVYDIRDENDELLDLATQLQVRGQNDTPAFVAMVAAMDLQSDIGKKRIEERVLDLNDYLKKRIVETWGEKSLFTPPPGIKNQDLSSGMASFNPNTKRKYEKEYVEKIWEKVYGEHKIWIRWVNFLDKPSDIKRDRMTYALRDSTHIFNDETHIDKMLKTVETVANQI